MRDNLSIRVLQKEDIPQLIELCKAHAEFEHAEYKEKGKKELIRKHFFPNNPYKQCLVLVDKNELLGYSTILKQFSTWDASYYYYMDCLYLKEEVRGVGYGSAMMNELKKIASQNNCHLQWQTPDFNQDAIRFYEALGAIHKRKERFFWNTF